MATINDCDVGKFDEIKACQIAFALIEKTPARRIGRKRLCSLMYIIERKRLEFHGTLTTQSRFFNSPEGPVLGSIFDLAYNVTNCGKFLQDNALKQDFNNYKWPGKYWQEYFTRDDSCHPDDFIVKDAEIYGTTIAPKIDSIKRSMLKLSDSELRDIDAIYKTFPYGEKTQSDIDIYMLGFPEQKTTEQFEFIPWQTLFLLAGWKKEIDAIKSELGIGRFYNKLGIS